MYNYLITIPTNILNPPHPKHTVIPSLWKDCVPHTGWHLHPAQIWSPTVLPPSRNQNALVGISLLMVTGSSFLLYSLANIQVYNGVQPLSIYLLVVLGVEEILISLPPPFFFFKDSSPTRAGAGKASSS